MKEGPSNLDLYVINIKIEQKPKVAENQAKIKKKERQIKLCNKTVQESERNNLGQGEEDGKKRKYKYK